jgi:hypothetical protein
MSRLRRAVLVGTAAVLVVLVTAGSVSAYTPRERRAETRQNRNIQKNARDIRQVNRTLTQLQEALQPLSALRAQVRTIADTLGRIDGIDSRLRTIEAAAPQIVSGLGQLRDGLEQAGDGLIALRTLATSQEYGIGQVTIGGTPAAGSFVITPDIPDAVQQATVSQQFIAGSSGDLGLLVGVRSGENDGTGPALPAAHCRVTIVDNAGGVTTSSPNTGLGGAPFWPIEDKSTVTSTDPANAGFPFGPKTSGADADVLTNLTNIGTNASAAPNPPNADEDADASAGEAYTVSLSCVDTSPSTEEPDA